MDANSTGVRLKILPSLSGLRSLASQTMQSFKLLQSHVSQENTKMWDFMHTQLASSVEAKHRLEAEAAELKRENVVLFDQMPRLKTENAVLFDQVAGLKKENAVLFDQVPGLKKENAALFDQAAALKKENDALHDQVRDLQFELRELRRIHQDRADKETNTEDPSKLMIKRASQ